MRDLVTRPRGSCAFSAQPQNGTVLRIVPLLFLLSAPSGPLNDDANPPKAKECVKVRVEARFRGLGYNHVVILKNTCEAAQECSVSTDVDPDEKHRVTVPGGEVREVVTRIGSPASKFKANVDCEKKP